MIMGFLVVLVNVMARLLGSGEPSDVLIFDSFSVFLQRFWKTDPVILMWTTLFEVFISRVSAISRSSMKSFGRFFSRYCMFCLVKDVPSFSSYRFVRASPGGVRNIPSGFVEKIFSSCSSSI